MTVTVKEIPKINKEYTAKDALKLINDIWDKFNIDLSFKNVEIVFTWKELKITWRSFFKRLFNI